MILGSETKKLFYVRCFYSLQKATFSFRSCFFSPLEKCKILISLGDIIIIITIIIIIIIIINIIIIHIFNA